MSKRQWLLTISLAALLGIGVVGALNGSYRIMVLPSNLRVTQGGSPIYDSDREEPLSTSRTDRQSEGAARIDEVIPPLIPLAEAPRSGPDLDDVLLLYDSGYEDPFDINFCRVAEYYGLLCRQLDLRSTELSDGLLRDESGGYFKLVGSSAETLLAGESRLSSRELDTLESAVEVGGLSLLISNAREGLDIGTLEELTDGGVGGVFTPDDPVRDWTFSAEAPDITREFTAQTIVHTAVEPQGDFGLIVNRSAAVTNLLTSSDAQGEVYPIFVMAGPGIGSVFVDSSAKRWDVDKLMLKDMYYDVSYFSSLVPVMVAMRYVLGDEAWHSSQDYANLTIDDPSLTEPFGNLSYIGLLTEMESHNFHTTIAMVPVSWTESEPAVVSLFLTYPERYSVAQHGNNGDGYEFYVYDESDDRELDGMILPPRSLSDQEADILQGVARMESHRIRTGIPFERVMVFPWGISPEPTLRLLKKHNFLGTINGQDIPLLSTPPSTWDYGMYQANMEYGNFPALTRRHPGTYEPFTPNLTPFVLDLFIDKPALFYSHASELFAPGIGTFNPVADEISGLEGEVEWLGLGDILKRLHLQKQADDGSTDIKMYGNQLVFVNETDSERTYHIAKDETLNVPISVVTVNGYEFQYRIDEGLLTIDVLVPAKTGAEIRIYYGN